MKFTFDYKVKPRYYHDMSGISKYWDIQVQKLIEIYDPKMGFSGLDYLWESIREYLKTTMGSKCTGYHIEKCKCMALYNDGVVQYYGEIIFDGSMSKENTSEFDIAEDFKEWMTCQLQVEHLYFDMNPIYNNLTGDVSVFVALDIETIRCKAELNTEI